MKPTEFDLARQEFYKTCPNLIVSVGQWENVYVCCKCDGLLDPKKPYMYMTEDGKNFGYDSDMVRHVDIPMDDVSCPHCFAHRIKHLFTVKRGVCDAREITSKLLRRRKVYTSKRPSWWESLWGAKQEYFYEYHTEEITI